MFGKFLIKTISKKKYLSQFLEKRSKNQHFFVSFTLERYDTIFKGLPSLTVFNKTLPRKDTIS
jgi:hypothetical protein